ncbi:MAG: hypothetical protein IIB66_10695 [Proteobacteria bacterium]|nr:hypothetical protein [Pseudomonadota bacterium]
MWDYLMGLPVAAAAIGAVAIPLNARRITAAIKNAAAGRRRSAIAQTDSEPGGRDEVG